MTPDFTARQGYLDAAPGGIEARYAWTLPGGRGAGGRVIDLEWGWRFSHEDLIQNQGGIVGGTGSTDTDHGTAVLGEISGDLNALGITGIAPEAHISAVAFSMATAAAIRLAADRLGAGRHYVAGDSPARAAGDRSGPARLHRHRVVAGRFRRHSLCDEQRCDRGGGGGQRRCQSGRPHLQRAAGGFPGHLDQPFNRANPQCGAIIVGAGAPPPGTHGSNHGPDRSRLDFSNFGACVDAQGLGPRGDYHRLR